MTASNHLIPRAPRISLLGRGPVSHGTLLNRVDSRFLSELGRVDTLRGKHLIRFDRKYVKVSRPLSEDDQKNMRLGVQDNQDCSSHREINLKET